MMIGANDKPDHSYYSNFSNKYYPNRKNGWGDHVLIYNTNVEEHYSSSRCFEIDPLSGSIVMLNDLDSIHFVAWWQGHAPWGYRNLRLCKNIRSDFDFEASQLIDIKKEDCESMWIVDTGHLDVTTNAKKGDRFNVGNKPAHIQGIPAIHSLSIKAYIHSNVSSELDNADNQKTSRELLKKYINDNDIDSIETLLSNNNELLKPDPSDGFCVAELLKFKDSDDTIMKLRDLVCYQNHLHTSDHSNTTKDGRHVCLCGAYYNDDINEDIETIKIKNYDDDNSIVDYGQALFERGVTVKWLVSFTKKYGLYQWPTWRVVDHIIKPHTLARKCRYAELDDAVNEASIGPTDIFMSHSWSGLFGTLVASAESKLSGESRVWCDIFAVRQWPGSTRDMAFEEVVKRVKGVIVVVSSIDRISELSYLDLKSKNGLKSLLPEEKKVLPFLRVWCLVEINAAIENEKPLIISCGSVLSSGELKSNIALLYNMQYFVQMEYAEATVASDVEKILGSIQKGIGYEAVNRRIRGAVIGAISTCPTAVQTIQLACFGFEEALERFIESIKSNTESNDYQDMITQLIFSAASGGYSDVLLKIINEFPFSVNLVDIYGRSALMLASQGNHKQCIIHLLRSGANASAYCSSGWNALCYGASSLTIESGAILIEFGCKVNSKYPNQPLDLAAQDGNLQLAQLLLNSGADINKVDNVGYTPLRHAVFYGQVEAAKLFLEKGASPNVRDNWDCSIVKWCLQGAVAKYILPMIKLLLQYDVEIDSAAYEFATNLVHNDGHEIVALLNSKKQF